MTLMGRVGGLFSTTQRPNGDEFSRAAYGLRDAAPAPWCQMIDDLIQRRFAVFTRQDKTWLQMHQPTWPHIILTLIIQ